MVRPASRFALAFTFVSLLLATPALAFEKQWHFGGGLGGALANGYRAGPALNAYGAYGISDVFDVRLEALASRHEPTRRSQGVRVRAGAPAAPAALFYGGKLALAYKIDVIEWIPYAGVSAGFLGVSSPSEPFNSAHLTVGGLAGLDYAVSRDFGLGACGFYDYALGANESYGALLLRAEYRFGW